MTSAASSVPAVQSQPRRRKKSVSASVLFDEPGPRAKRKIAVANVLGVLVFVALAVLVLMRLHKPPQGQNQLSAEELENLCTVMAQRLSILHGLNAPEFFDKSLFRHFIQTLLEEDVLRRDANGKLSYHELLGELAEGAAKRVLPAEIRLSIRQVALHRSEDAADISESVG